mgnify:CR=1 FL=1
MQNVMQNAFNVVHHVNVLKTQYPVSERNHIGIASHIFLKRGIMRTAIKFNDKHPLATQKIGKVRPDRHLTAEFVPV